MKNQFKIGVGREIISPPLGTLLYGYPRKRPASRVHDDLCVSAIACEQGDLRGVIISADICSVSFEITDKIRQAIYDLTGVAKENISFSTTHTHSGPAIKSAGGWGDANNDYVNDILIPKTAQAAKKAVDSMVPAVMGVSTTESLVGINRRQYVEPGRVTLGQNPFGILDKTMTVLAFKDLEGKPVVNMVHYGCHGTAAGGCWEITRDWPGPMIDRLEKLTGATTVFFNGPEGDVGPRLSSGGTTGPSNLETGESELKEMTEVGCLAALDATRAYNQIKDYTEVNFNLLKGEVKLPYKPHLTLEQVKARLVELGDKPQSVGLREQASLQDAVKKYEENFEFVDSMKFHQVMFNFNSTVFVPFPFELFSSVALRLRQFSPFQNTLCTCNTNGAEFYLPAEEDMVRGGYEVNIFKRATFYRLEENTDATIISENLRIMNENLNK